MNKFVIGGVNYKDGYRMGCPEAIYSVLDSVEDVIREYNKRFENQIVSYEVWNNEKREYDIIPVEQVKCENTKDLTCKKLKLVMGCQGSYSDDCGCGKYLDIVKFSYAFNCGIEEYKEEPKQEIVKIPEPDFENPIIEYNGNFSSTKEVRSYILDNMEVYEGYIVRSRNGWDSDTIYRWKKLDNGKIIWIKEKA